MTAIIDDWKTKQEITVEELAALSPDEVYLVDIRDEVAFERGSLPGAQNLNPLELQQGGYDLPEEKLIVCICMWGKISLGLAQNLREQGYAAVSLQGGYSLWLQRKLERETAEAAEDSERLKRIESSLRKKYKHKISTKFVEAVCKFELVRPGDKIAVCIGSVK